MQSTPTYLISEYLENNKCSLNGMAVLQKSIRYFTYFFWRIQKLLQQLGKRTVSGDTRFDRVAAILDRTVL
jgi:hypothetical protein